MFENFELYHENYILELKDQLYHKEIYDFFKNGCFGISNEDEFINLIKINLIISTVKNNLEIIESYIDNNVLTLILSFGEKKNNKKITKELKKYIDLNLHEILNGDNIYLKYKTLDLICEIGTTKENFEYIVNDFIDENQLIFLQKHKEFYEAIGKYYKEFKDIFIEKLFSEIYIHKLEYQINVLASYQEKHKEVKHKFEKKLIEIASSETLKYTDIVLKKNFFHTILHNKIISKKTKIYIEYYFKYIDLEFENELLTRGLNNKIEINIEHYIKRIENIKQIRKKMLFIDYYWDHDDLISDFYLISNIEKSPFEILKKNLINNTDYNSNFINRMKYKKIENSLIVNYLINKYKDLFWIELEQLYKDVLKNLHICENNEVIKPLKDIFNLEFYRECCLIMVTEIERLIRALYILKKFGVNMSHSNYVFLSLNEILKKNIFDNLFLDGDIKCLKYILIESDGFNYRNSIAHNTNNKLNIEDVNYLISIFIFILVSVEYKEF